MNLEASEENILNGNITVTRFCINRSLWKQHVLALCIALD
jgi:hypothetical protein